MQKYSLQARILHWLMAFIILSALFLGFYIEYILDKSTSENVINLYNLHKSFGVLTLIFIFIRILNRIFNKPPAISNKFNKTEVIMMNLGHKLLYIMMLIVPISGFFMSIFSGYGINFFGIEISSFYQNYEYAKFFSKIHKISATTIAIAIFGHIFFVIKHILSRDPEKNVIKRII